MYYKAACVGRLPGRARRLFMSALACVSAAAIPLFAVSPQLTSTTPPGGQRGVEAQVTFSGARLDDAKEIIFYSPGFTVSNLKTSKVSEVTATIKIAPETRLGEHLVRIRTETGISELRPFYVSALTNITEVEPNNEISKAQKIPSNVTINGKMGQEDVDYFQIQLKLGERFSAEVEAMRLGKTALDPHLALFDGEGKLVIETADVALMGQDTALSFIIPKDGAYTLEVRETSYSGLANSDYRLHVGAFPRPLSVFPLGGSPNEKMKFTFSGDAKGPIELEQTLPAVSSDKYPIFAEQGNEFAPSPNWVRVIPMANVLENDENHALTNAVSGGTNIPVAFNGIISHTNEVDWFQFKGAKNVAVDVTVYARRLRSRLDSVIEIYDAKGKKLAENDDAGSADSNLKFSPPDDGNYYVAIHDQLKRGGYDYPYRIEISPPRSSIAINIPQVARNDSQGRQFIMAPQGNRVATLLSAKRTSVSGPIELSLDGLPGGVTMHGKTFSPKQDTRPVVFEASEDAPIEGRPLTLAGVATNGVRGEFSQVIEFVYGQNNNVYYGSKASQLMVAVGKPAPFKVNLVQPKVPLVQSGTMNLLVQVEKTNGFDEPITLRMVWNPPGVATQPEITIPKGSNSVLYPLNANGGAELGDWDIALNASATVNGGLLWVSTQLMPLKVDAPFISGKLEPVNVEPGQTTNFVCKLDIREPFTGEATVKLTGLPEKITAPDVVIHPGDKEATFVLKIDADCPVKSVKNLACVIAYPKDGEIIPHTVASGGSFRVVPSKAGKGNKAVAAAAKKE